MRVHVFNLYTENLGNRIVRDDAQVFLRARADEVKRRSIVVTLALLVLVGLAASFWLVTHRASKSIGSSSATAISPKSIAVLPLENLARKKRTPTFADEEDELCCRTCPRSGLKVISRNFGDAVQRAGITRNLKEIARHNWCQQRGRRQCAPVREPYSRFVQLD